MAMPQAVDGILMQLSTPAVLSIYLIQSCFPDVLVEHLLQGSGRDVDFLISPREQVSVGLPDPFIPFGHQPLTLQVVLEIVHQASGYEACPPFTCFGILSGKEDGAIVEVNVLKLDPGR